MNEQEKKEIIESLGVSRVVIRIANSWKKRNSDNLMMSLLLGYYDNLQEDEVWSSFSCRPLVREKEKITIKKAKWRLQKLDSNCFT